MLVPHCDGPRSVLIGRKALSGFRPVTCRGLTGRGACPLHRASTKGPLRALSDLTAGDAYGGPPCAISYHLPAIVLRSPSGVRQHEDCLPTTRCLLVAACSKVVLPSRAATASSWSMDQSPGPAQSKELSLAWLVQTK